MKRIIKSLLYTTGFIAGLTGMAVNPNYALPGDSNISIVKAAEASVVSSGSFQPGVVYTLYDDNTLHIKSEYSDTVWSSGTVVDKLGKDTASQITKVVFDNTIKVSKLDSTFKDMTSLESINTGMLYADTRDSDNKIKDAPGTTGIPAGITMNETFMNCKKLKSLDLRGLDPSILVGTSSSINGYIYNFNATMFVGCTALETVQFNDYSQYSNVSPAICYRMAVISSKLNYASYSDGALKDAEIFNTATGKVHTIDYGLKKYISGATYYNGVYYNLLDYTCGNCYKYFWSLKEGNTKNASYTWSPRKFEVTYKKIAHHPLSKSSDTATESTVTTSVQTASQNLTLLSGNAKLASVDTFYNSDSFYNVAWKCNLVGYITETDKDKLKDLQNNTAYPQSKEYYDALKKVFITEINTDTYEPVYKSNRLTTNAYSPIIDGMTIYAIYETQDVIDKYFTDNTSTIPEKKTFTISFFNDMYPSITVKEGEALNNLPIPEAADTAFSGWNTKDGKPVKNGYIPTSDMVLSPSFVDVPIEEPTPQNTEIEKYIIEHMDTYKTYISELNSKAIAVKESIPLPNGSTVTHDEMLSQVADNFYSFYEAGSYEIELPDGSKYTATVTEDGINIPDIDTIKSIIESKINIPVPVITPVDKQESKNEEITETPGKTTVSTTEASNNTTDASVDKISLAKVKISKITAGKKKLNVKFKKATGAKSYEIQISTKKNMKKNLKSYKIKKTQLTIKKLKSKKTYYVRVRALDGNTFGSWSKITKIKTK